MILAELDRFLAEQRKTDAIKALARARSAEEVAAVVRRLDLAQMADDEGGPSEAWP
jgi:hypothetical protein